MKNIAAIIGWLLLIAGLGAYVFGIVFAIFFPIKTMEAGVMVYKIPEALETLTTSIGAILLTNLGAVLGISIAKPDASLSRIALAPQKAPLPAPVTKREWIQIVAVLVYVITLIACGIAWAIASFKANPDPIVALIPQYAKTLIGVITAYVAFVLAINSKN